MLQKTFCLSVQKPINGCYKRSKCTCTLPIYLPLTFYIAASSFLELLPDSRIDSGVWCRCDGASVSVTFISDNAST